MHIYTYSVRVYVHEYLMNKYTFVCLFINFSISLSRYQGSPKNHVTKSSGRITDNYKNSISLSLYRNLSCMCCRRNPIAENGSACFLPLKREISPISCARKQRFSSDKIKCWSLCFRLVWIQLFHFQAFSWNRFRFWETTQTASLDNSDSLSQFSPSRFLHHPVLTMLHSVRLHAAVLTVTHTHVSPITLSRA